MSKTWRRISGAVMVAALTAGAGVFTAGPAAALGNNRTVERSCGKNYVASGYHGPGNYSWVETVKQEGDCAGRLSVAFELYNGYWTQRVYGDRNRAYTTNGGSDARYGLHWGCDNCNVTRS